MYVNGNHPKKEGFDDWVVCTVEKTSPNANLEQRTAEQAFKIIPPSTPIPELCLSKTITQRSASRDVEMAETPRERPPSPSPRNHDDKPLMSPQSFPLPAHRASIQADDGCDEAVRCCWSVFRRFFVGEKGKL